MAGVMRPASSLVVGLFLDGGPIGIPFRHQRSSCAWWARVSSGHANDRPYQVSGRMAGGREKKLRRFALT